MLYQAQNRFVTEEVADETDLVVSVDENHHTLERAGGVLHYWLNGPSQAPCVVLSHGVAMDHHMFDAQIAPLASTYRVLTWDLRGHGLSQSSRLFDLDLAVEDLVAVLDAVGCDRCVLIGASVGSAVAQLFAVRHPERVLGLALFSSTPLVGKVTRSRRLKEKIQLALLRLLPFWFVVGQMPDRLSMRIEAQAYVAKTLEQMGKAQFVATWESILRTRQALVDAPLPEPLLVARGAYERLAEVREADEQWTALYPDAQRSLIPGAGHSITQDNPSFCNKLLRSFVRRCVRSHYGRNGHFMTTQVAR